jgi:hypothetical protein
VELQKQDRAASAGTVLHVANLETDAAART